MNAQTPREYTPFDTALEAGQDLAQRIFLRGWVDLMTSGSKMDINPNHFRKNPNHPAFSGVVNFRNFTPTVDDMRLATSVVVWAATDRARDILQFGRDLNGVVADISEGEKAKKDHIKHHGAAKRMRENFLKASARTAGFNRRIGYIMSFNMADYEAQLSREGVSIIKKLAGLGDVNERTRMVVFQTLGWLASSEGNTFINECRDGIEQARDLRVSAPSGYRGAAPTAAVRRP